ncbi:MAG TPA: PAS domain S-box protein [Bacteroidota bacterium]|jgi:PAS domain S-box-containing protein|nr:PAS domain S-box protein [Bacteroidota bacterium]
MGSPQNRSIERKIRIVILSISLISLFLAFAGFLIYEFVTARQRMVTGLETTAQILGTNCTAALTFENKQDATDVLGALRSQPRIISAAIFDRNNNLFATYVRDQPSAIPSPAFDSSGARFSNDRLILCQPIVFDRVKIGTIMLESDLQAMYQRFTSYGGIVLLVLLGSTAITFLSASKLLRRISRPILDLAQTARTISQNNDYSIRATRTSDDETGSLADAINQMLTQIQERGATLQRANEAMALEIAERKRAEEALRLAHDELEMRVQERTAELSRINEELRQSEARFRLMVSGVKDYAILMLDPEGRVISWNAGAERIKGYRAEEIIGKHFSCFYPADDQARDKPAIALKTAVEQGRFEDENWRVRKDGTRLWANVVITPMHDEHGQLRGFGKVSRDMTDRKRAEEEIRTTRNVLDSVIENMPNMLFLKDAKDLRFVRLNKAGEELLGLTNQELIGKNDYDFFPKQEADFFVSKDREVLRDKRVHDIPEEPIQTKHLGLRYLHTKKIALLDERGDPRYLLGISEDITEQKEAELAKRQSEELFQKAFRSSPAGIFISRDADGTIIDVNDSYLRMIGHTREEVIGHTSAEVGVTSLEDVEKIRKIFHEQGFARDLELVIRTRSGKIIQSLTSLERIEIGGSPALLSIVYDITERKKAEGEILLLNKELAKRLTELDVVNRELEAFSYSVSHDLRAPLRSIDGFSQALLEDFEPVLNDRGKDYLKRVRTSSQRMAQLIDDLLNLSRITRAEMRHEKVNLSEIAETIATELQRAQPDRRVEFRIAKNVLAEGDPRLLRIVMDNLMNNSWKYTNKRPAAVIEFGINHQTDRPAFFVRDDGAGFEMKYAQKLFGAFQRLHGMDEFPGSGIGLATVQRIIHRHGGNIWAEGKVDEGATFHFTLS